MRAHELDQLVQEDRRRLWRKVCGLTGFGCYLLALTTVWHTVGNPKTWTSSYHALATAGGLAWLAIPLLGCGTVLLIAAVVLTLLQRR